MKTFSRKFLHQILLLSAVVEIVSVEIGKAVAEVITRKEKQHELPVEEKTENHEEDPRRDLEHAPLRIERTAPLDLVVDHLRIVAEVSEEGIGPRAFRIVVMAVPVNGKPIDGVALLVLAVAVSLMMPVMDEIVKLLRETHGDREQPAKCAV